MAQGRRPRAASRLRSATRRGGRGAALVLAGLLVTSLVPPSATAAPAPSAAVTPEPTATSSPTTAETPTTSSAAAEPPPAPAVPSAPATAATPTAPAAPAPDEPDEPDEPAERTLAAELADGWYQAPHSSVIFRVASGRRSAATYAQWAAAGSPRPAEAPTRYVRHSWSPDVYAVTDWPDGAVTEEVTGEQWARSGHRPVTAVPSVPGTTYHLWGSSAEVFAVPPGATAHRLTGAQWNEAGQPSPERRSNQGWVTLGWAPTIGFATDLGSLAVRPATYAEWTAAGSPTPRVHARMPGDRFFTYPGAPPVYYEGPLGQGPVTARQWAAAGRPAPQVL